MNLGDYSYIYILDNDETIDSNNKHSTVKVFKIDKNSIQFVQEWNSETFGVDGLPINDVEVFQGEAVFVTLGNHGIGYSRMK